ncbi:zinc finger protein 574-like [Scleropages formosus]|uniref:Zinc finger protein 574-like n=1 Tax=Scleropages formosus TaxID=113540 RepID=A0A0P7V0E5_SCLFO|nr:zinc finger protein 574-like [Scleropages formosus]
MDGSSVYMCFPCYQEFNSLEEVLAHQLTCSPDGVGKEAPGLQVENDTGAQACASLMKPGDPQEPDQAKPQSPAQGTPSRGSPGSDLHIQYQCGDCGFLFESLNLWQQHRKLGECLLAEEEPGGGANELEYAELIAGQHDGKLIEAGRQTAAQTEADGQVVVHIEQLVEADGQSAGHIQQLVHAGGQSSGHVQQLVEADGQGESVRAEEWTPLEETGESGADKTRVAVGTESWRTAKVDELRRECRERERAVSQDHSYLQCDEAGESEGPGAAGTEKQKEAETVAAEVGAETTQSASEKEDDKSHDQNVASRKRGSRKSKASSASASSQSLLCVDCGCGFGLVPELVAHRRTHHGLEGPLHRCNICGESFLNTTLFLYHRRQHRKREHEGQGGEEAQLEEERSVGALERAISIDQTLETASRGEQGILEVETESVQVIAEENLTFSMTVEAATEEHVSDQTEVPAGVAAAPAEKALSFLCVACGSGFNTEPELVEHRRAHHALGEALHRCTECGQGFMNTTLFLYHRRAHRDTDGERGAGEATSMENSPGASKRLELLSPASVTPKRTSSPALSLLRKSQTENGGRGGADVSKDRVTGGDVATGDSQQQKCDPVPELHKNDLPAPPELYRDWSRTPLPHACPHCGRTFTRRCLLRAHVFSHTGEKLFSCKVCGKAFTCSSNLMRHSRTHLAARPYTCECCGKTFSQSSTLKRHRFTHASEDGAGQRPHACDDCPSRFHTRTQLQRHRLQHTGNPFSCSQCGQSFKRKRHLDLHSLTHQEVEPRSCPHCSAQFRSQSVLNVHIRRCSGEDDRARGRGRGQGRGRSVGQLECDMCGHCCAHVLAHCKQLATKGTGGAPRPFRCEHCGKGFAYASTFRLHMRIHTGERPYEVAVNAAMLLLTQGCFVHLCVPCGDQHSKVHGGSTAARNLAGEGEAAVRTILLVQTPAQIAEGSAPVLPGNQSETAAVFPGTASSVVLLHPSIAVVDVQDIQHAVEFIIEETV